MLSNTVLLLGSTGITIIIGILFFLMSYKYSQGLFDWIENQTLGTRTYILEQLERLFIEVKPEYITYTLLGLSFGVSLIMLVTFGILGQWILGAFLAVVFAIVGWKIPRPFINSLIKMERVIY